MFLNGVSDDHRPVPPM